MFVKAGNKEKKSYCCYSLKTNFCYMEFLETYVWHKQNLGIEIEKAMAIPLA